MEEFVDKIRSNQYFRVGDRADTKRIIECKNYLSAKDHVVFPDDYSLFIKYINGIISDTVNLFGVLPNRNHGFSDIVLENREIDLFDPSKNIVIGCNNFDFLVYNKALGKYQARDKYDGIVFGTFDDIQSALTYLLKM